MILSQFQLNLDHREARRDLGNPYEMHRTFSTRLLAGKRGLWRLEGTQVLLLSESEPQWKELDTDYFAGSPRSKPYPVDEMKFQRRQLRFRLKANPTKSVKEEGAARGTRGKRVQLVKEEHQLEWLSGQGERHGFRLVEATTSETKDLRFRKKKGQPEVTVGSCLFEGLLLVEDEQLFRNSLKGGIGRAKSFGLGLLSIAPG